MARSATRRYDLLQSQGRGNSKEDICERRLDRPFHVQDLQGGAREGLSAVSPQVALPSGLRLSEDSFSLELKNIVVDFYRVDGARHLLQFKARPKQDAWTEAQVKGEVEVLFQNIGKWELVSGALGDLMGGR